ncbi:MAG TPA: M48 family metallopeptidase [Myxococcota bacterium]|nr:M48 family metallopeptidase [Myxococcota bacterium]
MTRTFRVFVATLTAVGTFALAPPVRAAGDSPSPGFNLFTVDQDIEIGKQSAAEAEKQLTLLGDASVDAYLNKLMAVLVAQAPGAKYPYHAKAVNDAAVNAFALPGGPLYVNRGLLLAAKDESELAGVMSHEISHVALRHGTHQASKAYLAQAGLGILGGLLGQNGSSAAQMVNVIGGLGLNAAFLKFSRDAEAEADRTGAGIMARAGYDPNALADFFEVLRKESAGNPSALQTFLSDHPAPADREATIRALARTLPRGSAHPVGGFDVVQADVKKTPAAGTHELARGEPGERGGSSSPPVALKLTAPSSKLVTFTHPKGSFSIGYPANWQAHTSDSGSGASFFPEGGVVDVSGGDQALVCGVIVSHYEPFERQGKPNLDDATQDLVEQIERSNPYLKIVDGSRHADTIDGAPALTLSLLGRSPVTGEDEKVNVSSRVAGDEILYALAIAPEKQYPELARTFSKMLESLDVH